MRATKPSFESDLARAITLLQKALSLLDRMEDCAAPGAHLQSVIDSLQDRSLATPNDKTDHLRAK
jgi:hypothetical protein